jgi:hypothetical protein
VLQAYLKTTFPGLIDVLHVSDALCERLGRSCLPHYSTLRKFADRSSVLDVSEAELAEIVSEFAQDGDEYAVIDSTGMLTTAASAHFRARSGRIATKFVKPSASMMARR